MGKIGDLWVKLGLKKKEFDDGIKDAGDKVTGFSGTIKGMKGVAINAWMEIAKTVWQAADAFAHTTQRFGDLWDQTMAGMKGAWHTFVSAVSSTDFTNIGKRMADSFREARQLMSMKDSEFEVMNSIELQKSAMADELAVLRIRMQNQKLSQEERLKAQEEYLNKLKPLYDQEEQYRKKFAIQAQDNFLTGATLRETGKNREALQAFLTQIAPDQNAVKALDDFKKSGYRYQNDAQKQLIESLVQETGAKAGTLAKIAEFYQNSSDATNKELVDAIVSSRAAAGAFNEETRRVQTLGNSIAAGGGGGNGQDTARRQAESILQRAQDSAKSEIQLLTEKYHDEKALLEQYGLDTVALWEEYSQKVKDVIETNLTDYDFEIDIEPPEIDDSEFLANIDNLVAGMDRAREFAENLGEAISSGFSSAVQELTDQLTGLEDANPGRIFQALLTPLADMAIKAGEIIMAEGVATIAAREALEDFGESGWGAVAAGAALIAAGAAAKSGLAALASSGGRATTTTSYGSAGTSAAQTQTIQTEMTVYVTGRLSGSDILLSGQKTQNQWNR